MAEHKCVLGACCCGCTLKTGAWATAIICLVTSIINTANAIVDATNRHNNSSWGTVIVSVLMLIIAILLIHGVRKEQPRLIWVWVYTQIVLTVLTTIMLIVGGVASLNIIGLVVGLLLIAIIVYFILVVRSYAIELEGGSTGGANTV